MPRFLNTSQSDLSKYGKKMEELNALFHGFAVVLTPMNTLLMFVGVILGVLIGVLPGLGGANGVAILLPLTFTMTPTSAIIMLSCIYWGALFGGAITSILFNIPGEPWSVATTFDGYPMAQQGRSEENTSYLHDVFLISGSSVGDRCSAARSPRSCSTSRASPGRWPPPSTATRWRSRAAPGRRSRLPSPPRSSARW